MKIFNVALLACALEIGIVAAAQPFRNIDHLADFEKDLRGWDIQSDLPHDNNNRGFPVRAYIERSDEQAAKGSYSVKLFIDGKQDDGTIWLSRYYYLDPEREYKVTLDFDLWSRAKSQMSITYVPAYAGSQPPLSEADFESKQPGFKNKGWQPYHFDFRTQSDSRGRVWVAAGISVIWETEVSHYIDNFHVRIE